MLDGAMNATGGVRNHTPYMIVKVPCLEWLQVLPDMPTGARIALKL